jgi:hypothetical protein
MTDRVTAVLGGGGTAEQDVSAVAGGGGIAEHEDSVVFGGGGMAEHEESVVFGGGGTAEQDVSAVAGGGGIAEHEEREVLGGGGIAEQDSAVDGGGGIHDPERAGFFAPATPSCPDSIPPIMRLIPSHHHPLLASAPPHRGNFMIVDSFGLYTVVSAHDHEVAGMSEVQTTTRVRSPRNRSRANSSGSPERA